MYSMYSKVPCMDGFVNPCRCVCKCNVKIRGSPFFSEDLFQRSLKQYLISLEIIESLLLQCVPTISGDSRYIHRPYIRIDNLSLHGTFEYIPFTYYYGLHLRPLFFAESFWQNTKEKEKKKILLLGKNVGTSGVLRLRPTFY